MNLSDKVLSETEISLLSKGMNFSITPKEVPVKEIISAVENSVKNLDKAEGDNIRAKVSLTLQNARAPTGNLSKEERQALKSLKDDESIIILPADKGRATVVLNKDDYIRKCKDHIDNGPYERLESDPMNDIKKEVWRKCKDLADREIIDQQLYYKIKPTDSHAPRFYGLPKIHKPGIPIRPIVSYVGSPLYNLSKYVAYILKPYAKNETQHSKNSTTFSEFIREQTVEFDEIMASFDVTSLYTNVPINDTLVIIKDLLVNDDCLQERTKIPPLELLEIIKILLTETCFLFNGEFYKQTDGVAMGGPTSSTVAEIYMISHEQTALTTTTCPPKVWERYVDDVFLIIKKHWLEEFYDHINGLHEQIKFTIEKEKDSNLAFLDTLVHKNEDKSLSVKVYRKPTHTDQYLNFESNHSRSVKESVVSSLFTRARNIVSNSDDLRTENERIIDVLACNGYDTRVINKVQKNTTRQANVPEKEQEEFTGNVCIPYVKGTSEKLRRILHTHKIRCSFHSRNTLRRSLSQAKDPVDINQQSNVIYKIPCNDCNAVYIGETKRSFGTRSKEHEAHVRLGHVDKNEIADHCWKRDHRFNFANKSVLDREQNWTSRKIKESIYSVSDKNHINHIQYKLPEIWIPALTKGQNGN